MFKRLIILTNLFVFAYTSLNAQINKSYLNEFVAEETEFLKIRLDISDYKAQMLHEVLLENRILEADAILDSPINYEEKLATIRNQKKSSLKKILSTQEFHLYNYFSESSSMDRREHLEVLVSEYSKDKEFVSAIISYRESAVLPVLIVHRAELGTKISKTDKEELSTLRKELYKTLDKCLIGCTAKHDTKKEQYNYLAELLFGEITTQLKSKDSDMSKLLELVKKYEEQIHTEKSHFDEYRATWKLELDKIQKKYVLENHRKAFDKTNQVNSFTAWRHLRFDAFFLLLDPSSTDEAKKMLKLGSILLPNLPL